MFCSKFSLLSVGEAIDGVTSAERISVNAVEISVIRKHSFEFLDAF